MQHRLLSLLQWLGTPGNVIFLPSHHYPTMSDALIGHTDWMRKYNVDYVDSYLIETAHRITKTCNLKPSAPIVTFDTKDFWRCSSQGHLFSIFDMKDLDLISM
jgi:hypothetical protein